ncbi:MAG: site-2 protease family protein [Clostridia bacterium]|nr:site-2 protease family protein [Clostridia bacterium]
MFYPAFDFFEVIFISSLIEIWNNVWPYLIAVLMFLILIVIHEFGHFIVAKLFKVRVNEFAVGFGPKLFKVQGKETLYRFNLIPFGGYCAMEGEDEESEDPRAFCNAKAYKRFFIVAAGAVFNLILGLIIVAIVVTANPYVVTTRVARFDDNALSAQSGLMVEDEIIEIDGRAVYSYYDIAYAFTAVEDGDLQMKVIRNGEKINLEKVSFATESEDGVTFINLDFKFLAVKKTFLNVVESTFKTAFSYCRTVWFSLVDLIGGRFGISAVSGPVGVTATIGQAARLGLMNILPIMALITINLGVFNLLPVPALDGGRLIFILLEMILRRPVAKKYEGIVHGVGLALLLMLMVVVTFKDIFSLIK